MKKVVIVISLLLFILITSPFIAKANMAAPEEDGVASTITFAKNEDIAVVREVLDIKITGIKANISAQYTMQNNKDYEVSTPTMFISPNFSEQSVGVMINGSLINYETKSYSCQNINDIYVNGWEYVILEKPNRYGTNNVQTINFDLDFKAKEEKLVTISYDYELGGRPDRIDQYKYASLTYYLAPAALWESFADLTINLYMDASLPIISESNVGFKKIDRNTYQYKDTTIPVNILEIKLEPTNWQKFIGFFKSPYLIMEIFIFLPFILIGLILIVAIILLIKFRKKKAKTQS